MTTITVQRPLTVRPPRAAKLAAGLFVQLVYALQRQNAARKQRKLRAERMKEAAVVRGYAAHYANHDPRLAADLLAAADRHELME